MPEYTVTWVIDLEADSREDAARKALAIHRKPDSIATVFLVREITEDPGQQVEIDLTELDELAELPERLEYLRGEIEAERISTGELIELQGYGEAGLIDPGDVQLREWAGLPEFPEDPTHCNNCEANHAGLTCAEFQNKEN
jgi:hypothetical protein